MSEAIARATVAARFSVSRETMDLLDRFSDLVRQWSRRINLVAAKDLERLWERHIADSFGLAADLSGSRTWADLGAGGGFPLVPLAILARERGFNTRFTAYEADHRKAAFLRAASAALELGLIVRPERIERAAEADFDVVSCRAFASVDDILRLMRDGGLSARRLLLIKGRTLDEELTAALKVWHMRYQREVHAVTGDGYILRIEGAYRSVHRG